jgi:hypothetical protein
VATYVEMTLHAARSAGGRTLCLRSNTQITITSEDLRRTWDLHYQLHSPSPALESIVRYCWESNGITLGTALLSAAAPML